MGLATNARWMHSVHMDKRPEETKDAAERGPRISLTFHHISTNGLPACVALTFRLNVGDCVRQVSIGMWPK